LPKVPLLRPPYPALTEEVSRARDLPLMPHLRDLLCNSDSRRMLYNSNSWAIGA